MLPHQLDCLPEDEPDDFHAWLADIPQDAPAFTPALRPATTVDLTARRSPPSIRHHKLAIVASVSLALGLIAMSLSASHLLAGAAHGAAAGGAPPSTARPPAGHHGRHPDTHRAAQPRAHPWGTNLAV